MRVRERHGDAHEMSNRNFGDSALDCFTPAPRRMTWSKIRSDRIADALALPRRRHAPRKRGIQYAIENIVFTGSLAFAGDDGGEMARRSTRSDSALNALSPQSVVVNALSA